MKVRFRLQNTVNKINNQNNTRTRNLTTTASRSALKSGTVSLAKRGYSIKNSNGQKVNTQNQTLVIPKRNYANSQRNQTSQQKKVPANTKQKAVSTPKRQNVSQLDDEQVFWNSSTHSFTKRHKYQPGEDELNLLGVIPFQNNMQRRKLVFRFGAYDTRLLMPEVEKIYKNACFIQGLKVSKLATLPTRYKTYTFLRSPFVNKPAMEAWEQRFHYRIMVVEGASDVVKKYLDWFKNEEIKYNRAIGVAVAEYSYHDLEEYYTTTLANYAPPRHPASYHPLPEPLPPNVPRTSELKATRREMKRMMNEFKAEQERKAARPLPQPDPGFKPPMLDSLMQRDIEMYEELDADPRFDSLN